MKFFIFQRRFRQLPEYVLIIAKEEAAAWIALEKKKKNIFVFDLIKTYEMAKT